MSNLKIVSGNANVALAQAIAKDLGKILVEALIGSFSDGETRVEIKESVREDDVFVIQPTCPPADHNLMELLIIIDALKRASAKRITAVMPYYGYGRQDRKAESRVPITAKLVADLITEAGADRVVSMDLHAGQIQGYFNIPVDHLYASNVILDYLIDSSISDAVIVSPDAGGVERARYYGKKMNVGIAIIDKRREEANSSDVMNVIGEVNGKTAILLDDMTDTAGTLVKAADAILEKRAKGVIAACTHPVLSGPAVERLTNSPIKEIVVTDTIPLTEEARACSKIKVLSVCKTLAEAVRRIHNGDSVSSMFNYEAKK